MYYLLQIGMNTLLLPLGALSLSAIGLGWIADDELAIGQVKGKVNYSILITNS